MNHLRIAAVCIALSACGSSLPADGMTKFANVLESTKTAFRHVCNPPKLTAAAITVECRSPEVDAYCDIGAAYLDSAIGIYTELNNELKE